MIGLFCSFVVLKGKGQTHSGKIESPKTSPWNNTYCSKASCKMCKMCMKKKFAQNVDVEDSGDSGNSTDWK